MTRHHCTPGQVAIFKDLSSFPSHLDQCTTPSATSTTTSPTSVTTNSFTEYIMSRPASPTPTHIPRVEYDDASSRSTADTGGPQGTASQHSGSFWSRLFGRKTFARTDSSHMTAYPADVPPITVTQSYPVQTSDVPVDARAFVNGSISQWEQFPGLAGWLRQYDGMREQQALTARTDDQKTIQELRDRNGRLSTELDTTRGSMQAEVDNATADLTALHKDLTDRHTALQQDCAKWQRENEAFKKELRQVRRHTDNLTQALQHVTSSFGGLQTDIANRLAQFYQTAMSLASRPPPSSNGGVDFGTPPRQARPMSITEAPMAPLHAVPGSSPELVPMTPASMHSRADTQAFAPSMRLPLPGRSPSTVSSVAGGLRTNPLANAIC
jgi:hypothetical protein